MDTEQAMDGFEQINEEQRRKNSTAKRGQYRWTGTDLHMMQTIMQEYNQPTEIEALRLAMAALVTRRLPQATK